MSIDIEKDELLTLAQACRLLPKRPSPTTLWRWRTIGVRGVKLECLRVSGRWVTTARCMTEFIRRQADAHSRLDPDTVAGTYNGRNARTTAELRQAGLLADDDVGA